MPTGKKITFLDTPGHAAFTEMRARGANVTDVVVLVVAANDSIMPQTIEAINHAKAAKVPIIVAINKVDLPDADVNKVKQDLLQYEVVVEDLGGDVQAIEVSAKKRMNLDKLEEAILLQAEVLDLKANPNRTAQGAVVESKLEQGRGSVATVLIQKGTLRIGEIFVVGSEWGRVRALVNDRGEQVKTALPGQPVEVLGLTGTPDAGDQFSVVESEAKAREIVSYRSRKKRDATAAVSAGTSFEQLLAASKDGKKELNVVIKADVHGSVEAIAGTLMKVAGENTEVGVRVLHTGVGGITESDITLANASRAIVIGFNVRANAQARDMAKRDRVDIRYYNIIYNIMDDMKAILSGMLAPTLREEYLGQAEIRQVFNITKVGKVAGCMVTTGQVKRGAKVRLLRDDVVIHEGSLKTLKRHKDEVREVKEGMECGMAFENYEDIRVGDIIECFEVKSETRSLD
ncbi:MAG: translation initiation factor IF-2, partial [Micavibrio aeruginosavorus]